MTKIAQPKISIPCGVPIGFQIGFNDQIYTCVGHHDHVTKDDRILKLIDWTADCAMCGKVGFMTSKVDDIKPSRNCGPCRSLNRTQRK